MRLWAWRRDDGGETWGLEERGGHLWDGGRHTGLDRAELEARLHRGEGGRALAAAVGYDPAGDPDGPEVAALAAAGRLLLPWRAPEVWAAGVTYKVSEDARRRESQSADIYARVYDAERPEVFFKAPGGRVRGPGESVGLRPDSRWQVPEPELALVLGEGGRVIGYTCGNDMSCRDIEGENPLYLPQAKIYDGACALGPAVLLAEGPEEAHGFVIRLRIERGGEVVFQGETDTSRMVRSFAALTACLGRAYTLLPGTVLLTGAGVVPPDDFSLRDGDRVTIAIAGIGDLTNVCATVAPQPS